MSTHRMKVAAAATLAILVAAFVAISWSRVDAQVTPTPAASHPRRSPPAASPIAAGVTIDLKDIKFNPRQATIAANTNVTITLEEQGRGCPQFQYRRAQYPFRRCGSGRNHHGNTTPSQAITRFIAISLATETRV